MMTDNHPNSYQNLRQLFHHVPERVMEHGECGDTMAAGWMKPEEIQTEAQAGAAWDAAPPPTESPFSALLPRGVKDQLQAMSSLHLQKPPCETPTAKGSAQRSHSPQSMRMKPS